MNPEELRKLMEILRADAEKAMKARGQVFEDFRLIEQWGKGALAATENARQLAEAGRSLAEVEAQIRLAQESLEKLTEVAEGSKRALEGIQIRAEKGIERVDELVEGVPAEIPPDPHFRRAYWESYRRASQESADFFRARGSERLAAEADARVAEATRALEKLAAETAAPAARVPVESSNLRSVGYDPATRTLEVEFTSGQVYRYRNVPPEVHRDLMQAESKGQFFIREIRSKPSVFRYERVEATPELEAEWAPLPTPKYAPSAARRGAYGRLHGFDLDVYEKAGRWHYEVGEPVTTRTIEGIETEVVPVASSPKTGYSSMAEAQTAAEDHAGKMVRGRTPPPKKPTLELDWIATMEGYGEPGEVRAALSRQHEAVVYQNPEGDWGYYLADESGPVARGPVARGKVDAGGAQTKHEAQSAAETHAQHLGLK